MTELERLGSMRGKVEGEHEREFLLRNCVKRILSQLSMRQEMN